MARYFSRFPLTYYTLDDDSQHINIITNIVARFRVENSVRSNIFVYDKYTVKEGETPEIIASKIYDSPERHWIILLANNIYDVSNEWPLTEHTLNRYIDKKYKTESMNGIKYAMTNIHSYYKIEKIKLHFDLSNENITEFQIDKDTYDNLEEKFGEVLNIEGGYVIRDVEKKTKTFFEYEVEINENKRNIFLFRPEFVEVLEKELKRIFSEKNI